MDNINKFKEEQNPLFELKINQPQNQNMNQNQMQQLQNMQQFNPYVPVYNPYNPYPNFVPNYQPVVKKYNISLNPNQDIARIVDIYEDILPNQNNIQNNTFNTLNERSIIHRYLRSIFIKTGDGETLFINDKPNDTNHEIINLLSHVKLLELNPYNDYGKSNNPYSSLPNNFLLYRSCYPIKLNNYNNIECAKSSIAMHVRIYRETKFDSFFKNKEDEYFKNKILPGPPSPLITRRPDSRNLSNLWKELDYYNKIKEDIIKKKISPNFVMLHSWYYSNNNGISFEKIKKIRKFFEKDLEVEKKYAYETDLRVIQKYIDLYRIDKNKVNIYYNNSPSRNYISKKLEIFDNTGRHLIDVIDFYEYIKSLPHNDKDIYDYKNPKDNSIIKYLLDPINNFGFNINSLFYTSNTIIMLTEAPNQNIKDWASKIYIKPTQVVKKMVQTGYHDDVVWESIFIQLLFSILVMTDQKIMFTQFKYGNNVFIKDLKTNDQNIGIWKYIYNGIEYFVPNYGYLLLIDSNYADLTIDDRIKVLNNNDMEFKVYNENDYDIDITNNIIIENIIYDHIIHNLYYIFFNFVDELKSPEIFLPTEEFRKKIYQFAIYIKTNIYNPYFKKREEPKNPTDSFNSIKDEILKLPLEFNKIFDYKFLHNRIGTLFNDQEKKTLKDNSEPYKIGNLYVNGENQVCLCISSDKIITVDFDDNLKKEMDIISGDYSKCNLDLKYESGKQLKILETYLISLACI